MFHSPSKRTDEGVKAEIYNREINNYLKHTPNAILFTHVLNKYTI